MRPAVAGDPASAFAGESRWSGSACGGLAFFVDGVAGVGEGGTTGVVVGFPVAGAFAVVGAVEGFAAALLPLVAGRVG